MGLDQMDLRLLRVFRTVVDSGGFSAAQGVLNLSLATISTQISTLEGRLGLTLCRRGRGGFALTPDGRAIYDEFLALQQTLDQFDTRVRRLKGALSGALTLGLADNTIHDPAAAPLEQTFARFTDAAPGVTLTLVTRPPHELLRDVAAGDCHLAIASFPRIALGLTYVDLYAEAHRFYCGAGHPLFGRADCDIGLEEIRSHRIVGRSYWGARDMKVFSDPQPRAMVSDMEAEARLILSGRYLGYLPAHYARAFVEAGRLRSIRPDLLGYSARFQAAHDMRDRDNGIVQLFLRMLRAAFSVNGGKI